MPDAQDLPDYSEADLTVGHQKEYAAGIKAVAISMKRARCTTWARPALHRLCSS